jgi:hypothetical protein
MHLMALPGLYGSFPKTSREWPLTIGSSDRGSVVFGEPRRESMIGIKCLRLTLVKPYVAQPHR